MKNVWVICDGMADEPVPALGYKTPLESAFTPSMDRLALHGICGSLQTIPAGHYPGSEVAILTILGYTPEELPTGRGALEAEGLGIKILPQQIAMRYALTNSAVSLCELEKTFTDYAFHSLSDRTGICIARPEIKTLPDSSDKILFWSEDIPREYIPFPDKHNKTGQPPRTAMVGAVPLVKGIASALEIDWIKPDKATGDCDTDYKGKGEAAITALNSHDIVIVHIEACDYASHKKDPSAKVHAIENIDRYIITPIMNMQRDNKDIFAIAVMSDHPSLCEKGCHSTKPVPFLYYYPGIQNDTVTAFSEKQVVGGSLKNISDIYEQ